MTSSWHRSHVILVDFADLKGRPDRWCPALECCVVNECRILAFAFRWFSRGQISAMTMGYISLMICDLNNLLNDIAQEQHNFQWTLIALMPTFKYLYTGNLLSIYKLSREEPANAIVGVMAIIYPNYCTFYTKSYRLCCKCSILGTIFIYSEIPGRKLRIPDKEINS